MPKAGIKHNKDAIVFKIESTMILYFSLNNAEINPLKNNNIIPIKNIFISRAL